MTWINTMVITQTFKHKCRTLVAHHTALCRSKGFVLWWSVPLGTHVANGLEPCFRILTWCCFSSYGKGLRPRLLARGLCDPPVRSANLSRPYKGMLGPGCVSPVSLSPSPPTPKRTGNGDLSGHCIELKWTESHAGFFTMFPSSLGRWFFLKMHITPKS